MLITIGIVLMVFAIFVARSRVRNRWQWTFKYANVLALLALGVGFTVWGSLALAIRTQPDATTTEAIFQGVTYTRDVRTDPRPLVIHVVEADLTVPGVSVDVTPPDLDSERALFARTTSGYLEDRGVQVAVNGNFFEPHHDTLPWWFYPRAGDPVDVIGVAAHAGEAYTGRVRRGFHELYISADGRLSFDQPLGEVYHAIGGLYLFVRNGQPWVPRAGTYPRYNDAEPRTAVAVAETGTRLLLFVVDGRQPGYSEGIGMAELADIVIEYGGYTALNLDGGGSTAMAIEGQDGAELINSPVQSGIPGRERPVANHLGIFAPNLE